jgi:hypothetical protein
MTWSIPPEATLTMLPMNTTPKIAFEEHFSIPVFSAISATISALVMAV